MFDKIVWNDFELRARREGLKGKIQGCILYKFAGSKIKLREAKARRARAWIARVIAVARQNQY